MTAWIEMREDMLRAAPVVRRHSRGPVLCWGGYIHWLTWRERLVLWLGLDTVEAIAERHWPERVLWRAR